MTKTSAVARLGAALLLISGCPAAARAADAGGLDLPQSCASVRVATLHPLVPAQTSAQASAPASTLASSQAGFDATQFDVHLPRTAHGVAPSMSAAALHVASNAAAMSQAALERAASAAAAALLISITGNGHSGCPAGLLQDAGRPIADGLGRGGNYVANWRGVTFRGTSGHISMRRMELRFLSQAGDGAGRAVHVALTLDGITGSLAPPVLLPDHMALNVTLPAASLPILLAATGGAAPDARIPVTINSLHMTQGKTVLDGQGSAIAAATPTDSSATLHLSAHDFHDLVTKAAVLGSVRMHAALFMADLMGRSVPHGLQWDVTLEDGLLLVNKVPIPIK